MNYNQKVALLLADNPYILFKQFINDYRNVRVFDFIDKSNDSAFKSINTDYTVGKYSIIGIANYNNLYIIDRNVILNENAYRTEVCIDFDSNILGALKTMIINNQQDDDLKSILIYIKEKGYRLSCSPYLTEVAFNDYNHYKEAIYNTLLSFSIISNIDVETLKSNINFNDFLQNSNIMIEVDDRYHEIVKNRSRDIPTFLHIYILILNIFFIKHSTKKSPSFKFLSFVSIMTEKYNVYFELECNIAYSCFYSDKNDLFYNIQPNSKDKIKKLKAIAWDVFHIRNEETSMAIRNNNNSSVYLHAILTGDKGMHRVMNSNKITRMISEGGSMSVKRKNIFENNDSGVDMKCLNTLIENYYKNKSFKIGLELNELKNEIKVIENQIINMN